MMRSARTGFVLFAALVGVFSSADTTLAQSFRRGGTEFDAARPVTVPAGRGYTVVVVEFLHQGEIRPDGRNVIVAARNKDLVPFRVLQLGPGDFCRLAFQTVRAQGEYEILYGGEPPAEKPPPWTCRDGLLLETRQFRPCNFRSLDSVRDAFNSAAPIGADYVEGVFHGENPFTLKREPFLSRYSGCLDLKKSGTYGFFSSSQDCSFLLIDGKLAASSPGYHGPLHNAHRGTRHDVELSAGLHKFEYYHAAAGPSAAMVAAWEINPRGEKPQNPVLIPAEVFRAALVGHLPAGHVTLRGGRQPPDFLATIAGEVPLPDNDVPLLGVGFHDNSPKALSTQGAKLWDFGDGQTSSLPNPAHVYLRPGLYAVKLSIRRAGKTLETTNHIYVDRPLLTGRDRLHTLDEYLRIVEDYDPKTLDAASLRQLVLTLEAKALALANRTEDVIRRNLRSEEDPNRRRNPKREAAIKQEVEVDQPPPESDRWLAKAVAAGRVAFVGDSAAKGDAELLKLAQLIGPMARVRLGDSETAFEIWAGAAKRIAAPEAKAQCEIAAADVAVNDLLKPAVAKPFLEAATRQLGQGRAGPIRAELSRIWGDYHAATGDGPAARKAYLDAQQLAGSSRRLIERTAWLGAHARSTEEFIKQKQFVRAAEEIEAWQREFPAEKLDGYLTLQCTRYWAGRKKYAQAIAQTEQLQAVSPDSPYMDQLLFLAADSEMRLGHKDRALATLHALLKDYPGSPLAPLAKKNVALLEGGKAP